MSTCKYLQILLYIYPLHHCVVLENKYCLVLCLVLLVKAGGALSISVYILHLQYFIVFSILPQHAYLVVIS